MRNISKGKATAAIMSAAAELAEKLSMEREEDVTNLWEGQAVMIATSDGIQIGKVKIHSGETHSYRYQNYNLKLSAHHEDEIFYLKYALTDRGWNRAPTFHVQLPPNAIIYTGGIYKD